MLMPLIQNVFMENISIPAMAFVAGVNSQPPDPSEEESANIPSLSIMVQILMLGSTFIFGHILKRNKIMIINEAGAALLLGVLVGLIVRFSGKEKGFSTWIDFNERFFFYFLLPPIIFESGWSLRPRPFFKNFGAICVFAFGGTLISAFGVGILVYIFGVLHWTHEMPFLVCLTFGALISATDPVTVLAIFHELGTDANLYAYVFGESVLNDAVAITMFKTVLSFMTNPTSNGGILGAFSFFIAIFVGSFSIGVLAGMLSALLFKYGGFQEKGLSILESCLVVLFPYLSYMMADALDLSGIVAILFAGITMKYYTAPNLSLQAQQITTSFFGMLAKLSETFVFIYVGVATFLEKQSWHNFGFTFVTILSILISRAWNVYTCSALVNCFRKKSQRIPFNHQHALWYSGLRGAMAFALALQSVSELPNDQGRVLLTSTLLTIFFTVLLVGGSTPYVLHLLQIECRGPDHDSQKEEDSKEESADQNNEFEVEEDVEGAGSLKALARQKAKLKKQLQKLKNETSFETLDKKYLQPFFASTSADNLDVLNSLQEMHDQELELERIIELNERELEFSKLVDRTGVVDQERILETRSLLSKDLSNSGGVSSRMKPQPSHPRRLHDNVGRG